MTTDYSQHYVPTDVDHAAKSYDDHEAGKTKTVKPPAGKSIWFILPARKGASQGASPFKTGDYVHFVRLPQDPDTVFAVGRCPSKTKSLGRPCPGVCQLSSRLKRSEVVSDRDLGDRLTAKEHVTCNAVRLDVDQPKGPEILQLPQGVYGDLSKILRDKTDGMDFTNPLKGRAVIIERTGTTKENTEYSARLGSRDIQLPKMEWLGEMHDLDAVYEDLDENAIRRALFSGEAAGQPGGAVAPPAPSGGAVAPGAGEQKQIAAAPPAGAGGHQDLVENPITGEWEPRKK